MTTLILLGPGVGRVGPSVSSVTSVTAVAVTAVAAVLREPLPLSRSKDGVVESGVTDASVGAAASAVGALVGRAELGVAVDDSVGPAVGALVGASVGLTVGAAVGKAVGVALNPTTSHTPGRSVANAFSCSCICSALAAAPTLPDAEAGTNNSTASQACSGESAERAAPELLHGSTATDSVIVLVSSSFTSASIARSSSELYSYSYTTASE